MGSAKDHFESNYWEANYFASGMFRGTGIGGEIYRVFAQISQTPTALSQIVQSVTGFPQIDQDPKKPLER